MCFCCQHSGGEAPACPGTRGCPLGLARGGHTGGGGLTAQNLPCQGSSPPKAFLEHGDRRGNFKFITEPSFGKAFVAEIWYFKV